MKWQPEWRSALAEVWPSGLSTSKIAGEFTLRFGVLFTKNAVVGQSHKCKLDPRPQPGGRKSNNFVIPPTATHGSTARPFATTAESEALIRRLAAAGHSKTAIEGMQPHKRAVIDRILGMRDPIARPIPSFKPRIVCAAPPKPPEPTRAPIPRGESERRCEWLDGDKPYVRCTAAHLPGMPYCEAHAARSYVHWPTRRSAPVVEALA